MLVFQTAIRYHLQTGFGCTPFGLGVGHPELEPNRPRTARNSGIYDLRNRLGASEDIYDIDGDPAWYRRQIGVASHSENFIDGWVHRNHLITGALQIVSHPVRVTFRFRGHANHRDGA